MKKFTEEQIEEIINKAGIKCSANIALQFSDTLSEMLDNLKDQPKVIQESAVYLSSIMVVQSNCISIIKETLKELLCD